MISTLLNADVLADQHRLLRAVFQTHHGQEPCVPLAARRRRVPIAQVTW